MRDKSSIRTRPSVYFHFVRAVCIHLFFLVIVPFTILLIGFRIADAIAIYVIRSGKEWELEGIYYLLGSVVLATCSIGFYLYYLRRRHRVLYGLMELAKAQGSRSLTNLPLIQPQPTGNSCSISLAQ